MIKLENVDFSYLTDNSNVKCLSNINYNINDGECIVLCGSSGCGKTSFTRLINGLIPTYYEGALSGSVKINGKQVKDMELYDIAKEVGSVFQNPKSQFFNNDVTSELCFVCQNLGYSRSDIEIRMKNAVSLFDIENLIHKDVAKLSGGQKQKIACACVATPDPDIYIFDEPSANLDEQGVSLLKEALTCFKSNGKTIIVAEHRLHYLSDIADKYLYMDNGKIASIYNKEEFLAISNEKRIKMGLRSLKKDNLILTPHKTQDKDTINFKNFIYKFDKKDTNFFGFNELKLETNKIVAITGCNGVGKSTFANLICGLYKSKGEMILNNISYKNKQLLNKCFLVMQDCNRQLFTESVIDEILLDVDDVQIAENILKSVNLFEFKERHPASLSGGQKQRLAVATALASKRDVIVFDEPTSGLDYKNMIAVSNLLKDLKHQASCIMVITHDDELINECADYIVQMEQDLKYRILKKDEE